MKPQSTGWMKRASFLLLAFFVSSCASYYKLNFEFNRNFEYGDLSRAQKLLNKNEKQAQKKSRFLYFVNRGVVEAMLGNYETSNEWFERAYLFGEDYQQGFGNAAAALLVSPTLSVYKGEDHEHLLLLYYKAFNYLKLGDYEKALVECRRLNNRLYALSEKYRSDNKYKEDAFSHTLMGLIYQASKDYNNAFIAYRNALKIYEEDYSSLFSVGVPGQLKEDLIRTAEYSGFYAEAEAYRDAFGLQDFEAGSPGSSLVFFWHNGLGPVKTEASLTFTKNNLGQGQVVFSNPGQAGDFRFEVDGNDFQTLQGLSVLRVAVPKYVERPPAFVKGQVQVGTETYPLELAEDVQSIAQKTLQERLVWELGKSLLRVGLKKAVEQQVRKEGDGWGTLVSVLNAVSEQADTRNWQTLPHSIYYTRVPLEAGRQEIELQTITRSGRTKSESFTFEVVEGETVFHNFQSLESRPLSN